MEETLITQTTTQAGQKKKKAVKYINPSTTNEKLKGFAQQIVALTTDNFDGASVTSYRTKGEVVFTDKPTPNLSIGSWSAVDTVYTAPITYDGDGALSVNIGSISNGSLIVADEDGIFSGVLTRAENVGLGVWTSTGKTSTVDSCSFVDSFCPALTFGGDTVTVAKGETARPSPILFCEQRIRNSSGTYTTGGDVAAFNAGYKGGFASKSQLTTISGGVASTVNPWILDDDNVLLGVYPDKEHANAYAITYKPGSYSKASWLNDAFTLWNINFLTPRFVKTTKTLIDFIGGELPTKLSPNLRFTAGNIVDVKSIATVNSTVENVTTKYTISYLGETDRKITFSGKAPDLTNGGYTSNISKNFLSYTFHNTTTYRTGNSSCTLTVTIAGNEKYKSESATITITGCYNDFFTVNKSYTPK